MFRLESCPMPVVFESSGPIREMFESFAPQVTVNCLYARARNMSDFYYASKAKGLSCCTQFVLCDLNTPRRIRYTMVFSLTFYDYIVISFTVI